MERYKKMKGFLLITPLLLSLIFFFIYPLIMLFISGFKGEGGITAVNYLRILSNVRYRRGLINSVTLSSFVTLVSLIVATLLSFFLVRFDFRGKKIYKSLLTFPISFPGVVVGFMIIILFGNTGIIPNFTELLFNKKMFNIAYKVSGLFVAYLYFLIPRVTMSMISAVSKFDLSLEEAAQSLGASNFQVLRDVTLPALKPALVSSGALAFATSMGAFGTAFTLAEGFEILPMLIYTEYTLSFNIQMASAMAFFLGLVSLIIMYLFGEGMSANV